MGDSSGGPAGKPPDIAMQEGQNLKNTDKGQTIGNMEYGSGDMGPFYVIIESKDKDKKGVSRMHPMSLGKLLHLEHPLIAENILSIKKLGINRVRIEFNNGVSANKLVVSDVLKEKKFNAYIPKYLLQRRGIIRGVDTEIQEQEIKEVIRGPPGGVKFEMLEFRRLKRKVMDRDTREVRYVPTQSVLMTVKGQQLPQHVYIHYVRCEVHNYIQSVIQCKKCLRFGHFLDQCKGSSRCERCGDNHESKDCEASTASCCNCGGVGHTASNLNVCPRYKKERSIKQIMGTSNISYLDAISYLDNNSFAAIAGQEAPNVDDAKNFPALNKMQVNSDRQVSSTISYKRATKRSRNFSPSFDRKEMKEMLLDQGMKKNVPGGLVPGNPHRRTEVEKAVEPLQANSNRLDIMFEAVYSIIKSVNADSLKDMSDDNLKSMIKERVTNLNEAN